jgi:hypothetical protein
MTGWQYVVGRTMFETDKLPQEFVPRQVYGLRYHCAQQYLSAMHVQYAGTTQPCLGNPG